MPTPTYQGQGQPTADDGGSWLGRLGSYFGGPTAPVYATVPAVTAATPAPATTPDPKSVNTASPIAKPMVTCPIDPAALASGQVVLVVPQEAEDGRIWIDPNALAAGQIAIVVPRNLLGTP